MGAALEVKGLSRRWGAFSLKEVSMRVEAGEYFVLLGPNGSGKSLLAETILGFHSPDSGSVLIAESDVTELPPEERRIGYVPQQPSLFPHMTVRENVTYGLRARGAAPEAISSQAARLLKLTRLESLAQSYPSSLSGGEKQRATLARALAGDARLVVLDEPLSGVDVPSRGELMHELKRISRELGATVLHITHDVEEALSLADRVGVIVDGRIQRVASPSALFDDPGTGFVARMLGYDTVVELTKVKAEAAARLLRLDASLAHGVGSAAIRGDLISLLPLKPEPLDGFIECTITGIIDRGFYLSVEVDAGIPLIIRLPKRSEPSLIAGSRAWVRIEPGAVKLLQSI